MSDTDAQSARTARFYDELAGTYHALYPDWDAEVTGQARTFAKLLGGPAAHAAIVDTACGIGTQLVGLAALGYRMFGSDLSPAAVARARDECAVRGLSARLEVADMRALPWPEQSMDAAVCADNAIPHLLADDDVLAALVELRRVLRPGSSAALTIRDYDACLDQRPTSTPVQVMDSPRHGRMLTFQLWSWHGRTDVYDLEHFQLSPATDGTWSVARRTATYRAYTRAHMTDLALAAGLVDVRWLNAQDAGYLQPVMIAARPDA